LDKPDNFCIIPKNQPYLLEMLEDAQSSGTHIYFISLPTNRPTPMRYFTLISRGLLMILLPFISPVVSRAQLYIAPGETVKVVTVDDLVLQEDLIHNVTRANLTLAGGNTQSLSGTGTISNFPVNKSACIATITTGNLTVEGVLTIAVGTLLLIAD